MRVNNIGVLAMATVLTPETFPSPAGHRKGPSLLIEDDVLSWLIDGSNITSAPIRRHIELAICHLAQNRTILKLPRTLYCRYGYIDLSIY